MNGVAYYKLTDGDRLNNPPKLLSVQNLLPFPVTVLLIRKETGVPGNKGMFKPLLKLNAKETKTMSYPPPDYEMYITSVKGDDVEGQHLTMPVKFGFAEKYFIGGISWNSFENDTNTYNLFADLPGVHLINHFPFPVYVQYKNLSFVVPKKSRESGSFEGGSPSTVYFDNQGWGLDVNSLFSIKGLDSEFYKFTIPNRFVRNIHIGMTSSS